MTTNELVALRVDEVEPNYYQDQEEGYTVITSGLPGVARFHKANGRILFDGISNLAMVDGIRVWPPQEGQ